MWLNIRLKSDCLPKSNAYSVSAMYFRQSRFVSLLLAILVFSSTWAYSGENAVDRTDPKLAHPTKPATFYKIQAGIEGEIYPVFANYASLSARTNAALPQSLSLSPTRAKRTCGSEWL